MHLYDRKEDICLVKLPFRRDDSHEEILFQDGKLTGISATQVSGRLGAICP